MNKLAKTSLTYAHSAQYGLGQENNFSLLALLLTPLLKPSTWVLLAVGGAVALPRRCRITFLACTIPLLLATFPVEGQQNLLVNGDFESGNTAFSSGYQYSPGNIFPEGTYDVLANPCDAHPYATCFGDHTTGSGKMLAVNGGSDPGQIVWSETVNVETNTTYLLSGWGASWYGDPDPAPAQLLFSVNGTNVGNAVQIPGENAIWQNFTATWNSQTSTQAVIQVRDLNTVRDGNDFALDDLVFAPLATNIPGPLSIYRAVEIEWDSVPNTVYQIQWASALPASNWFNLGNTVTAITTNTSAWDRVAPGKRFYRVLQFR